jgi:hypothetical protein
MRMHYISKEKKVKAVQIDISKPLIEMDGYHQVTPASVFHHEDHKDQSICIVLQDRVVAWGDAQPNEVINGLAKQIRVRSILRRKTGVDSAWSRWIKYLVSNGGNVMLILIGVGLLALFIITGGN